MSAQSESLEEEKYLTVFEGSSPEDVSHARRLWSSLSLLPPQESRLVSADIRQRLPVSRPQRSTATGPSVSVPEPPALALARQRERQEERRRYEAMAETRREILGLLRRQREQRIQKELLSTAFRPELQPDSEKTLTTEVSAECEGDKELVQQLQ